MPPLQMMTGEADGRRKRAGHGEPDGRREGRGGHRRADRVSLVSDIHIASPWRSSPPPRRARRSSGSRAPAARSRLLCGGADWRRLLGAPTPAALCGPHPRARARANLPRAHLPSPPRLSALPSLVSRRGDYARTRLHRRWQTPGEVAVLRKRVLAGEAVDGLGDAADKLLAGVAEKLAAARPPPPTTSPPSTRRGPPTSPPRDELPEPVYVQLALLGRTSSSSRRGSPSTRRPPRRRRRRRPPSRRRRRSARRRAPAGAARPSATRSRRS